VVSLVFNAGVPTAYFCSQGVFENPAFSIDPTSPLYKQTAGTMQIVQEAQVLLI
jgi:hypothetical protein